MHNGIYYIIYIRYSYFHNDNQSLPPLHLLLVHVYHDKNIISSLDIIIGSTDRQDRIVGHYRQVPPATVPLNAAILGCAK